MTSVVVKETDVETRMAAAIIDMLASETPSSSKKPGSSRHARGDTTAKRILLPKAYGEADKKRLAKRVAAIVRKHMVDGSHASTFSKADPAVVRIMETLDGVIVRKRAEMSERNVELLVEAMLPANDPLAAVRSKIETDNAKARVQFIEKIRCLTSEELAGLAGHSARNKSVTGSRWKAARKVFSVQIGGRELYPAFQFRDGKPGPVVANILAALPEKMTPWQIAFWFVSSNPWLDGAVPFKMLGDEKTVVEAARRLSETPAG